MSAESTARTRDIAPDERAMFPRPSTANAQETPELRPSIVEGVKQESPPFHSSVSMIPAIEKAKNDFRTGDGVAVPAPPPSNAGNHRNDVDTPPTNATEKAPAQPTTTTTAVHDNTPLDDAQRITTLSMLLKSRIQEAVTRMRNDNAFSCPPPADNECQDPPKTPTEMPPLIRNTLSANELTPDYQRWTTAGESVTWSPYQMVTPSNNQRRWQSSTPRGTLEPSPSPSPFMKTPPNRVCDCNSSNANSMFTRDTPLSELSSRVDNRDALHEPLIFDAPGSPTPSHPRGKGSRAQRFREQSPLRSNLHNDSSRAKRRQAGLSCIPSENTELERDAILSLMSMSEEANHLDQEDVPVTPDSTPQTKKRWPILATPMEHKPGDDCLKAQSALANIRGYVRQGHSWVRDGGDLDSSEEPSDEHSDVEDSDAEFNTTPPLGSSLVDPTKSSPEITAAQMLSRGEALRQKGVTDGRRMRQQQDWSSPDVRRRRRVLDGRTESERGVIHAGREARDGEHPADGNGEGQGVIRRSPRRSRKRNAQTMDNE